VGGRVTSTACRETAGGGEGRRKLVGGGGGGEEEEKLKKGETSGQGNFHLTIENRYEKPRTLETNHEDAQGGEREGENRTLTLGGTGVQTREVIHGQIGA